MVANIDLEEFKDALSRYPDLLKKIAKPPKEGALSLEELDKYRYQHAPMNFSKNTGRVMDVEDLKKIVDWKIRHGVFRPFLPKQIAKNTAEEIATATKDAFEAYAKDKSDITTVINKLSTLSGVGPATASLLLAIHDPQDIIFFSDELYYWLLNDGKKTELKYRMDEYEDMIAKAKEIIEKVKCTPIELEKVAYVLIKESEPVKEPKAAKEPSGRGRGRPAMSEADKQAKKEKKEAEASGRGRGRPAGSGVKTEKAPKPKAEKVTKPKKVEKPKAERAAKKEKAAPVAVEDAAPKKRGRPSTADKAEESPKKKGRPAAASASETPKKRGRPAGDDATGDAATPKQRGRPAKATVAEEAKTKAKTPTKKRKSDAEVAPAGPAKRGRPKKA